jgi:uncharacterized protein YdhG (YjbR/CyaY superfamily)
MMKVQNVDDYISQAPAEMRDKLKQLRQIIKTSAPKAEEKLSYGMPYYGYLGRLAYFAYAKNHIGLYLIPPLVEDHKNELEKYETAKSTIRFPLDQPLPVALIKKLVKIGVKNNEAKREK